MIVTGSMPGIWISMPEWTDQGIIVSVRAHGEHDAVVNLLTEQHGRHAGLVKAGLARSQKNTVMIGNLVQADWRARLPEQLGSFRMELQRTHSASYLDDPVRLAGLGALCALIEFALPEREPQPVLWQSTTALLEIMSLAEDDIWLAYFIRWELGILAQAGFGLALDKCAVSGATDKLAYISPKTGHAVTEAGAGMFKDRLLPLPQFLGGTKLLENEYEAGMALSTHFLRRHLFDSVNKDLPQARLRLAHLVANGYR